MMNSPVSYMGNNPIRDQIREWFVRGRSFKKVEGEEEFEEIKAMHEKTRQLPLEVVNCEENGDFSNLEVEGGFDF